MTASPADEMVHGLALGTPPMSKPTGKNSLANHSPLLWATTWKTTNSSASRDDQGESGMPATVQSIVVNKAEQELTDGLHLVIDPLKLNGINTVYGVPGIPITDLGRMAQAAGIRVISFRHEQNAGNAAAIAGYLTKMPGVCLTVSAPGFLNGLTALANATTNCFPMILISGSSEREIVDLQQGDYEEMDQLAIAKPLCKAAFRVLHAADIGIGLGEVAGQGHRPGSGPDSGSRCGQARARCPQERQAPPDHPRQRCCLRA